jgi:hypothetical protein
MHSSTNPKPITITISTSFTNGELKLPITNDSELARRLKIILEILPQIQERKYQQYRDSLGNDKGKAEIKYNYLLSYYEVEYNKYAIQRQQVEDIKNTFQEIYDFIPHKIIDTYAEKIKYASQDNTLGSFATLCTLMDSVYTYLGKRSKLLKRKDNESKTPQLENDEIAASEKDKKIESSPLSSITPINIENPKPANSENDKMAASEKDRNVASSILPSITPIYVENLIQTQKHRSRFFKFIDSGKKHLENIPSKLHKKKK